MVSMIYKAVCGDRISGLAFGTMRLPQKDGAIDQEQVNNMTDYAIEHGVNYFDTAYPYHDGRSELAIGEALSKHPREAFTSSVCRFTSPCGTGTCTFQIKR